jgi:hypothetical protein
MTDEELEQAKAIMDILKYDIEINEYGTKFYRQHGKYHRDDGPAIEHADGNKCYYQHDKRHRDDGPAIESANGYKSWWLNGVEVDPF